MAKESSPSSEEWYAELIDSANADVDVSEPQMQQALRILERFMPHIEQAVSDGDIAGAGFSFTVKTDFGDLEFNYATD